MTAPNPHCTIEAPAHSAMFKPMEQRQRFTLDGSDALEQRLEQLVNLVRDGVLRITGELDLEGLLLGGGYGRGEGGVLRTAEGDLPYNDLEFYVFFRGSVLRAQRKYGHRLHELGEELSHQAGIEVELKVFSLHKLRSSPPSMFFYDLFMGHRWVVGGEQLLRGCEHHAAAEHIPLHEATRLLMNRCSGLLFAAEYLQGTQFGEAESDFVNRNLYKLRLALGDALLTAHGQYHWSCRERHRRLELLQTQFPSHTTVVAEHARGVEFKLHPFKSSASRAALELEHASLSATAREMWLWVESKRLGVQFRSPADYAESSLDKCPHTGPLKNMVLNLAYLRAGAFRSPLRHPRQRVFDALSLLLWSPLSPATLHRVQTLLHASSTAFPALVGCYRRLWSRVN